MQAEIIFRVAAISEGILLLVLSFFSVVKRKMTEGIALGWAVGAVLLVLLGAVPALADWSSRLSATHVIALLLFATFVVAFVFRVSSGISELAMKNRELAIQISLLNQENEKILQELERLTGKKHVDL